MNTKVYVITSADSHGVIAVYESELEARTECALLNGTLDDNEGPDFEVSSSEFHCNAGNYVR